MTARTPKRAAAPRILCWLAVSGVCLSPVAAAAASTDTVTLVPSSLDLPSQLSAAQFEEALTLAAARWSYPDVPCTRLVLQAATAVRRREVAKDGRNLFVFRRRSWCHNQQCGPGRTFPRLAAAMTTVHDGRRSAGINEADVELNGLVFRWSPTAEPSAANVRPTAPLVPVLVHEIGHMLGFEDACGSRHDGTVRADCAASELESVMVSGSGRAALSHSDVDRLCSRFPRRETRSGKVPEPATTAVPHGWIAALAVVVLIVVFWRWRRWRA